MPAQGSFDRLVAGLLDAVPTHRRLYAHCDIPCGIYDPHAAQIAALTAVRMCQLIGELPKITPELKPEERAAAMAKLARYQSVKEAHAEHVKAELRILWGDYFTPDHAKANPAIHEMFWKAMKAASKVRQSTELADAQELLNQVQSIAETFWSTKGVKTRKIPSSQKPGGELVYPA